MDTRHRCHQSGISFICHQTDSTIFGNTNAQSGNRPIFRGYVESHRYLMSEWQAATELATSLGLKGAR